MPIARRVGETQKDVDEFRKYQTAGGGLGFDAWMRKGKPSPPTQLTELSRRILERAGIPLPPAARVAPPTPGERVSIAQREARGALGQIGGAPPVDERRGVEIPRRPTEPPPSGFRWGWDNELNRWIPKFTGLSAQQQAQQELSQQELELRRQQAGPQPISPFQQQQLELERQRFEFERQQAQPRATTPFQQQQFDIQQQQIAQQEAQFQAQLQFQQEQAQLAAEEQERQYRSQLAANPINWLQYSAYTGEEPVIQPWMIPLGFQNTGGTVAPQGFGVGQPVTPGPSLGFGGGARPGGPGGETIGGISPFGAGGQAQSQLQAGQPIPGFGGQAGQRGTQTFANLPALTTPSAQLQARWGPTAQAQFLGYRQARTGAAPQESQFRLASGRAPTGRFGGFSRFR